MRGIAIDMIDSAKSGHPGIALGAAPIIASVYGNHLKFDPENDKWINRDRFIMSSGHGSSLLYSCLYMAGFNIELDDLKDFRKFGSIFPGHPEYEVTPGVDMSTGPLGQGISTAVGIALGEKYLREHFGSNIINFNTYVLCGDGCLMEGVTYEACSLAGKLGLGKLIVLYDSNNVTLDGALNISFNENIKMRFEAMNWNYLLVEDGENLDSLNDAIIKAKAQDKPTIIEVKTIIGRYSKNQGSSLVHGAPLDKEDLLAVKEKLNLREAPFSVSNEALTIFRNNILERNKKLIDNWNEEVEKLDKTKKRELNYYINSRKAIKVKEILYDIPEDGREATRVSSGKVLNEIAKKYPFVIGGTADVSASTFAKINSSVDFSSSVPSGRNINFGIREHAMGAIASGLALVGFTPFASTFLAFSDYLKPAIRMSALMNLPVIYILTHDSISVGEDGPTHQPVEQIVALRSTPNLDVYRPADANEVIGCYRHIFETRRPSALILGRNKVEIGEDTSISNTEHGAYILGEEPKKLEAIIIATGEEVELARKVTKNLREKGYGIRLISMPSIEVFERETEKYQEEILPKDVETFVIEASSSYSWYKYVKDHDHLFTVDEFGYSGNKNDIFEHFGLTDSKITKKIEELLN